MRNILLLAANTLRITFRKKGNIIAYLIMPVVTVMVSVALYGSSMPANIKIGVVDRDQSILSKDMTESLKSSGKFNVTAIDEKDIKEKVASGKIDCAFIIPAGFSGDAMNNSLKELEIISIKGEDTTAWIKNYLNSYVNNLLDISKASEGKKDIFNQIYESSKADNFKLKVNKVQDETLGKNVTMQSLGFLVMFMMLSATSTSALILKEKRNRTYYRILSEPVGAKNYIFGNLTANVLISLVQICIVIFLGMRLFHVNTFVPPLEMIVILMSFGIASIGLGIIIVAFSNTSSQAGGLSTLIITPTCMLGGCFWPASIMPDSVQKVSNLIPQKWTLDAINKIQTGSSFSEVTINIAIVLAFALVFFLIGAYKLKNNDNVKSFV